MNKDTGDCDCSYMVTEGNERAVVAVLGLLSLLCIITTIAGTVLLLYPRLLHNCLQKLFSRHVSIDETLYPDKDGATDYSQTYRSFSPGDPDEYMYEEKDNVASCMATYRSSEQNWPDQENYRQRYRIDSVQDNRSQPFSPGFPEESMFEEKDNATSGIAAYRNSRSPSPFPDRIWLDQDNLRQGYVIDTSMQDDRSLSPLHKRKNIEPREAPSNINTSREWEEQPSIMSSILMWRDEVNNAQRDNNTSNVDISASVMRQPSPSVWLPPSSSSPIQSLRPPLPEEYSMRSLPRLSSDLILREPSPSFHDKILRETSPSFHDKILREPSPSFHDKILREPSPSFRDKNLKAPSSHDVKSIQQLSPKLVRTSPSRPRLYNEENPLYSRSTLLEDPE
ncbi:uncharacterized protein LOC127582304 [Pristis pectinata]|uniref:uncharacterized protein LOC127582304 n=1 Tax=Pristis pectinata TaxID=685728 RepID=UPI00223DD9F0|nr:uncharacterized protein LOC127582304 [Pristis pectinata]